MHCDFLKPVIVAYMRKGGGGEEGVPHLCQACQGRVILLSSVMHLYSVKNPLAFLRKQALLEILFIHKGWPLSLMLIRAEAYKSTLGLLTNSLTD